MNSTSYVSLPEGTLNNHLLGLDNCEKNQPGPLVLASLRIPWVCRAKAERYVHAVPSVAQLSWILDTCRKIQLLAGWYMSALIGKDDSSEASHRGSTNIQQGMLAPCKDWTTSTPWPNSR